jgi:hypothetical protein
VIIDKLNQPTPVTVRPEGTHHTSLAAHFTRGRLNNPLHVRVTLPNGEDKEALLSSEVILAAFLQPGRFTGIADYINRGFTEMDLQDCWSDGTCATGRLCGCPGRAVALTGNSVDAAAERGVRQCS